MNVNTIGDVCFGGLQKGPKFFGCRWRGAGGGKRFFQFLGVGDRGYGVPIMSYWVPKFRRSFFFLEGAVLCGCLDDVVLCGCFWIVALAVCSWDVFPSVVTRLVSRSSLRGILSHQFL